MASEAASQVSVASTGTTNTEPPTGGVLGSTGPVAKVMGSDLDGGAGAVTTGGAGGVQNERLLKLQRESLRIEETILVAQRRVHYQRQAAQTSIAEALEATQLKEKEDKEREQLDAMNRAGAEERKTRKACKGQLMSIIKTFKEKQIEIRHLKEAAEKQAGIRLVMQQKRTAFQLQARLLEEREKRERQELLESHDRAARNLTVWQELDMRQLSAEEQESARRINKLKAQHLKELQQKEAEQLRELQHLKAKFTLGQFDMELEFSEMYETTKATQLVDQNKLELSHQRQRRGMKDKVKTVKEDARAAQELEMQAIKARHLRSQQEQRARDFQRLQKRRARAAGETFEAELQLRAEEFNEQLNDADFQLGSSSGAGSSKNTGSQKMSSAVSSQPSLHSSTNTTATGESVEDMAKQDEETQQAEQQALVQENAELQARIDRHRDEAAVALKQANAGTQKLVTEQEAEKTVLEQNQKEDLERLMQDWEEKKAAYRRQNELDTMELMQTHNLEKSEMHKAHERELEALSNSIQLEKQLHNRTITETQVASQAKSEFLSFVCHELRNPLSGIVAIVDMVLNSGGLDGELKSNMQTIKQESELMCAIVNDVLDYAKIEANMLVLDPAPFTLHQTIKDLVKEQSLVAKKTRPDISVTCQIEPEVPHKVIADSVRVRQVLLNLISNAVKFTFQGTVAILVAIDSKTASGGWKISFSVKDTGVGIAKKDLEHVFSAFSQAKPSTTREFGGTGLGLSISKALVERMGGTITLDSEKGVGTTFTFSICVEPVDEQVKQNDEAEEQKKEQTPGFPPNLKVLVVEDSNTLRRLWAKLLKEQGCDVEAAGNGQDAVDLCSRKHYDVVLMDITMPVLTGDQAVAKLREMGWKGVVVALTANAMETDRENYIKAGMDAVVTKPFQMDHLRKVVLEQLAKKAGT